MDYTVHGILQARILEWVVFTFSRGSSQPRDQTQVSRMVHIYLPFNPACKRPALVWPGCDPSSYSSLLASSLLFQSPWSDNWVIWPLWHVLGTISQKHPPWNTCNASKSTPRSQSWRTKYVTENDKVLGLETVNEFLYNLETSYLACPRPREPLLPLYLSFILYEV